MQLFLEQEHVSFGVVAGDSASNQGVLDLLLKMAKNKTDREGHHQTRIPFLSISKRSRETVLKSGVLTPSFCLILQGTKKLYLGQDIIYYQAGDYLTSLIDMPASGQTVIATEVSPYFGLRIDLTIQEITAVIVEAGIINAKPKNNNWNKAAFVGKSDFNLLDSFTRLLKLLDQKQDISFLSNLIKREMIFYLLTGDYGHLFLQQIFFNQQADGIGKAIAWVRQNYMHPFTVTELAKMSNMSVSGLHHKFKAITTLGPLQYQKNLRLQEARRLMLNDALDATTAAREVGYESPTQFNREYRRLFGLPPLKDIKEIRQHNVGIASM